MSGFPRVAVGAIALSDDRLLMIRRGHGPAGGKWSVPGGKIEHGELVAEAVVRELAEETGLRGVCGPLVGIAEVIVDDEHFVILDHQVTVLDDGDPVAGDDAAEAAWVPVADVCDLQLVDGLAEFLHEHGFIPTIA